MLIPDQIPPRGRRYATGAELSATGVSFRIWAPQRTSAVVMIEGAGEFPLTAEDGGYFSALVEGIGAGAGYSFRIEGGEPVPDLTSRYQPKGPKHASMVMDDRAFPWTDSSWKGMAGISPVILELHVGTFTPEGTWAAATQKLEHLRDVGITVIEIMPINDFEGTSGWGYDGSFLFAPCRLYGSPDDFRAFIDRAHSLGLAVILDVVYNHVGDESLFEAYSPLFFSEKHGTEWGRPPRFDEPHSEGVRAFVLDNVAYWIAVFHLDGLRIDATQALNDDSEEHIIAAIARRCRQAAVERQLLLVAENEPQLTRIVRPREQGGFGLDALWNDDFHHSAVVALTGRSEAYYHDHAGAPQEFIAAAKYGYLFQGQRYDWQKNPRGKPALDLLPPNFVHFLMNHDQIANSGVGLRPNSVTAPALWRAMTALLLLGPQIPLLFQGQEFGATTPFFYFLGVTGKLAEMVKAGRIEFLAQFPSLRDPAAIARIGVPSDPETFQRSKLDWSECERNADLLALHKDLLRLRREDVAISGATKAKRVDGAVMGDKAFLLRFFGPESGSDRLAIFNFGRELRLRSIPDPLSAPSEGQEWQTMWCSEDPTYGGGGRRDLDLSERSVFPAQSAWLFEGVPARLRKPYIKDEDPDWQMDMF